MVRSLYDLRKTSNRPFKRGIGKKESEMLMNHMECGHGQVEEVTDSKEQGLEEMKIPYLGMS